MAIVIDLFCKGRLKINQTALFDILNTNDSATINFRITFNVTMVIISQSNSITTEDSNFMTTTTSEIKTEDSNFMTTTTTTSEKMICSYEAPTPLKNDVSVSDTYTNTSDYL